MNLKWIVSYGKDELKQCQEMVTFFEDPGEENQVVNIYPDETFQIMEGFGGALTDAAGYVYSTMSKSQQKEVLNEYFSPDRMNYEIVRIHMDSCDFSTHLYSAVTDPDDTQLETFDMKDTEKYIIPLLDAAEKIAGKKLKIMLTPWSPPEFMKTNGCRKNGGFLKSEYRDRWAAILCRYILELKNRGYDVQRMSIQNEPKAVQIWDSCVYTAQEEKAFLRDHLYPALKENGLLDVEVFIWDHNKERAYERACDIIDEETDQMITGVAYHWYSGDHFEALDLIRDKYPDKKLILSESCLEFCKVDRSKEAINSGRLAHDMIGNLNHGMNAFYDWNILLDEKGGPNHVENFCDAPYLYHEDTKELEVRRIQKYYWHFTHFIQPGARRVAITRYTTDLDVTAWKNPDDGLALICLNNTVKEIPVNLRIQGKLASFVMKPFSIASGILEK